MWQRQCVVVSDYTFVVPLYSHAFFSLVSTFTTLIVTLNRAVCVGNVAHLDVSLCGSLMSVKAKQHLSLVLTLHRGHFGTCFTADAEDQIALRTALQNVLARSSEWWNLSAGREASGAAGFR